MTRIDLHTHTCCSDGSATPEELVYEALEAGLVGLAITDHDTLEGLPEARATAAGRDLAIFSACEISTALPSGVVHILAYGVQEEDKELRALLEHIRQQRTSRNEQILDRLRTLGVPVAREDVQREAHGSIVARPHIAQALVRAGHVEDVRQAFDRYLNDQGPAYVQADLPDPLEAIRVTVAAGGAPVVAHPRQMRLGSVGRYRRVFTKWRDAGLAGIEVQHVSHDTTHRNRYTRLCDELELVPTGGSDFHGSAKPWIHLGTGDGTIDVHMDTWDALASRMANG